MSIHSDTETGVIVELYKLTRPEQTKTYTSGDANILYGGETYRRATISRSSINNVFGAEREQVTVDAMVDDVFVFLKGDDPSASVTLTITRYNITSGEVQQVFYGNLYTYTFSNRRVTAVFNGDGFKLDEQVPKVNLITLCNHALYSEHCALRKNDWKIVGRITAVAYAEDSYTVTVIAQANDNFGKSLIDYPVSRFAFAIVEANGYYRMCTAMIASGAERILTLSSPFPGGDVEVGRLLNIYPGCNRKPTICRDRFDNLDNFLGFPTLPIAVNYDVLDPQITTEGDPIPLLYGTLDLPIKVFYSVIYRVSVAGLTESQNRWAIAAAICYGPVEFLRMYCGTTPDVSGQYWYDLTVPAERDAVMEGYSTGALDNDIYPVPDDPRSTSPAYNLKNRGVAFFWAFDTRAGGPVELLSAPNVNPSTVVKMQMKRSLSESPVTPSWITGDYPGVSPAAAIYDLLTNTLYGAGVPTSSIDLTIFDTVSAYCQSKEYSLNYVWTKVDKARSIVAQICDMYGLRLVATTSGKIGLIADNSNEALTPAATITENELNSITLTRGSYDRVVNRVIASYTYETWVPSSTTAPEDRVIRQTPKIIVNDSASQLMLGRVQQREYNLQGFHNQMLVAPPHRPLYARAYEILKGNSFPRFTGSINLPLRYDYLTPGQSIRITHTDYAVDALFRILQRDLPDNDGGDITMEVEQISESVFNAAYEAAGDDSIRSGGSAYVNDVPEELYFDPYATTSEISTRDYTTIANIVVFIDNGEQGMILLAVDTDYTVNDEAGDTISITLTSTWSSAYEGNSLGELRVYVLERTT